MQLLLLLFKYKYQQKKEKYMDIWQTSKQLAADYSSG